MESTVQDVGRQVLFTEFIERLLPNRQEITYAELKKQNLPIFFKSFIKSQVKRYLETESPIKIEGNSRYRLDSPEIEKLTTQMLQLVQEQTIFTKQELTDAVEKTVSLQIDFLIQPRKTLQFIFYKTKAARPLPELVQAITKIADQRPFIQHLLRLLKESSWQVISEEQFNQLSRQAELAVYQINPVTVILDDITRLLELFNALRSVAGNKIKPKLVQEMLEVRELTDLSQKMQQYIQQNPRITTLDLQDIKQILTQNPTAADETDDGFDIGHILDFTATEKSVRSDATFEPVVKSNKKTPWLLKGTRGTTILEQPEMSTPAVETGVSVPTRPQIIYKDEPLPPTWKKDNFSNLRDERTDLRIERNQIESQPEGPIPDLAMLIDPKSQRLFVKKLFLKDEFAYEDFIKKLEPVLTWKEAKIILDQEWRNRRVEPFSHEAILFGDFLFSRYFPKKQ
ncbi:hypothetical protein L0128_01835 [candidate division KSB1 bacterium]|nr:hypothetical protein [candidate division KSB1 bacterium]